MAEEDTPEAIPGAPEALPQAIDAGSTPPPSHPNPPLQAKGEAPGDEVEEDDAGDNGELARVKPGLPPKVDYQRIQAERQQRKEPGFFTIHKRGQGYWTRMGTAAGAALIGALTADFLYTNLRVWLASANGRANMKVVFGIVIGFLAVYGAWIFRLLNKPRTVDFLIATDSEMKKVNWTTRQELIGSTKVVILFMFIIALVLFVIDTVFAYVFFKMHVLQVGPFGGS